MDRLEEIKKPEEKKKTRWVIIILFFCIGIIVGMAISQVIMFIGIIEVIDSVSNSLEGTDLNINLGLNETNLLDGFYEKITNGK